MAKQIERKRIEEIIREEVANLDKGFLEQVLKEVKKRKQLKEAKKNG